MAKGDTRGKLYVHNFNPRYDIARVRNLFLLPESNYSKDATVIPNLPEELLDIALPAK